MRPVYLDNNATTRTDPAVVAAMLPFFCDQFGNASSSHAFGNDVAGALRHARRSLQALLGAAFDHEIVFTSGGTEADNTAILSALDNRDGRNEIVTSAVEHPAILTPLDYLEHARGIKVHRIGVDARGGLDIEAFRRALGRRTAMASVMSANNETGTLFPVAELAEMAHRAGALFHTDAVQAVGKVPLDLKATQIDMLSLSGHKLHGPKGIGAIYLRKGTPFNPLMRGGPQERRRRGGTENVPGIVGLGKAAELALSLMQGEQGRVSALRDHLERGILDLGQCMVLGDTENRLPNTSNIAFEHLEGEAILHHLGKASIAASLGSACASGSMEPSHVLRAMNVRPSALRGAIRFSLSRDNTIDDVARVLSLMPDIVAKLRALSPSARTQAPMTASLSPASELT
ncbi:cysteine desulfurase NifS [Rhodopseudomonas sp. P2A-2r]|uniref:cysteine desulfurase NifS n=1 Tax=Rhodopseudomonas sp. P2A-2r TaxID=2991972 RepID=UPI00223418B8|nr:cysteine desulfurase NifS [Rhodopseudomonas sp. P2A-2r]UZE50305.1 cysteine desulfurase NifS [Rhodopseudomonas sp. P2A-2r]